MSTPERFEELMAAEKRATDAGLESPVQIIRQSIASCQCCAPKTLTGAEVAEAANAQTPWEIVPGSSLRWSVGDDEMPVECAEDSNRQHWILSC